MKLNTIEKTETNCDLPVEQFKIKTSALSFQILTTNLYSNPILAIVRELLTNAHDAHIKADTLNIPIDVTFPTALEETFIIRDYGTGLSKEQIFDVYTTFFDSDKTDSNKYTGCLGLGSKTPFSYTDSFKVTSFYESIKYTYIVSLIDGYPSIVLMNEEETFEHNGLEVQIAVHKDKHDFLMEAKKFLKYNDIKINSNRDEIYKSNSIYKNEKLSIYEDDFTYRFDSGIYIKQGQNIYPLNDKYYESIKDILDINNYKFIINVPLGNVSITPSREHLHYDYKTIDYLTEKIDELKNHIENNTKEYLKFLRNDYKAKTMNEEILKPLYNKHKIFNFNIVIKLEELPSNEDYFLFEGNKYGNNIYLKNEQSYSGDLQFMVIRPSKTGNQIYTNISKINLNSINYSSNKRYIIYTHKKNSNSIKKKIKSIANYLGIENIIFFNLYDKEPYKIKRYIKIFKKVFPELVKNQNIDFNLEAMSDKVFLNKYEKEYKDFMKEKREYFNTNQRKGINIYVYNNFNPSIYEKFTDYIVAVNDRCIRSKYVFASLNTIAELNFLKNTAEKNPNTELAKDIKAILNNYLYESFNDSSYISLSDIRLFTVAKSNTKLIQKFAKMIPNSIVEKLYIRYYKDIVKSTLYRDIIKKSKQFKEYEKNTLKPYEVNQIKNSTNYKLLNKFSEYDLYDVHGSILNDIDSLKRKGYCKQIIVSYFTNEALYKRYQKIFYNLIFFMDRKVYSTTIRDSTSTYRKKMSTIPNRYKQELINLINDYQIPNNI